MISNRSDPRPMLAILACALAIAAWDVISNLDVDGGRSVAIGEKIALGASLIASALAMQRLLCTRRTLRSRSAFAVVPADEFETRPEAVLALAGQLARADRTVRGWLDRPACAIRICLTCDAAGQLVYLVAAPSHSRDLLRSALRSYKGVEFRAAEEVVGAIESPDERDTVLRSELVLADPSIEPLAKLDLDPDPLQPFASSMSLLRPEEGESASVCLDLLPAIGWRRSRLRRKLRRQARRRYRDRPPAPWLGSPGEKGKPREQIDLLERRDVASALDAKLRDAGSLFEAQILIRVQAKERRRAKATMRSLLGAFGPLAARNWLRVSGLPIPGIAFLGTDIPLRRASFDRRFSKGLFRPARRNILTARELAGFLKPPSVECHAENVLRSGALLSPPPELPSFDQSRGDLIPLGRITSESGERIVAVRTEDTFFSYLTGRSRYGKTETAIAQFTHLVRSGHGGLFIDPHGDGLERVEPYLVDVAPERIVRIDLGPGSSPAAQPGWNLFEFGRGAGDGEARVEAVVDAFASALEWGDRSTRAINLTTQASSALMAIARRLDAELAPTIFQIPTLLSDPEWREAALPFLPRAQQRFWRDRFPLLAAEAITPVTNMVDRLRASSSITALLGQSRSTYRVREAMDEGKIVLACPGAGGTRDRLIANLLLFDLLHAARGRAELAPERRRPFWVFLDEVQSYDGAASGNLAGLLEQSAKFGLRAVLANQNPERLSPATLNALTTNRSHLLASTLNSHAAGLVTKEWGGQPSPKALTRLPRFRFVAQVTYQGALSSPFALGGVRVEDVFEEKPSPARPPCEGHSPGVGAGDVRAHLDGLDDRILAALQGRGGERGEGHTEGSRRPGRSGPVRIERRSE